VAHGAHVVDFYASVADLTQRACSYLAHALDEGAAVVIVATPAHLQAFGELLAARGVDLAAARAEGRLLSADAARTLSRFVVDGAIDEGRFEEVVGGLLRSAAAGGRRIAAYGEMVQLLWEQGEVGGALELETCWNRLAGSQPFSLYCAYRSESIDEHAEGREAIERLHDSLVDERASFGDSAERALSEFPCHRGAARAARHFALEVLRRWEMGARAEEVAVVVTELASNALRHAKSPFTVELARRDGRLRASVRDGSEQPPVVRELTNERYSGRGLVVVARLASDWGYDFLDGGKAVWAEFDYEVAADAVQVAPT